MSKELTNKEKKEKLASVLQIQPPERATVIENQQVYKVVLDGFYRKEGHYPEAGKKSETKHHPLDFRIYYWYTEYHRLEELLQRAELDHYRAKDLLNILENKGISPSEDVLADKRPSDVYSSQGESGDPIPSPVINTQVDESSEIAKMINAFLDNQSLNKTRREIYHQLLADARLDYIKAKNIQDSIQSLQADLLADMRSNGENLDSVRRKLVEDQEVLTDPSLESDSDIVDLNTAYKKMKQNRDSLSHLSHLSNDKSLITEWQRDENLINWFKNNKDKFNLTQEDENKTPIFDFRIRDKNEFFVTLHHKTKEYAAVYYEVSGGKDIKQMFNVNNDNTPITYLKAGKSSNSGEVLSATKIEFFKVANDLYKEITEHYKDELSKSTSAYNKAADNFAKRHLLAAKSPIERFMEDKHPEAKVYFLHLRGEGWVTQDGMLLKDLLKVIEAEKLLDDGGDNIIVVCPKFDNMGNPIHGLYQAIVNPEINRRRDIKPLPEISFIETYETAIRWAGYCLGELSYSVNMFPGETKELIVEKATKKTIKSSTKSDRSDVSTSKETTSFEDSLQDELSSQNKVNRQSSQEKTQERRENIEKEQIKTHNKGTNFDFGFSNKLTGASFGGASASGDVGFSFGIKSTDQKTSSDKNTQAIETAQGYKASESSGSAREKNKKQVQNTTRKTASDVSRENKVSFTATRSEDNEESKNEKEIIRLSNPNLGKTVNYNFFQLQNIYKTETRLSDIKILVDPGVELIAGSGISDKKIYDVEEFNKIYFDMYAASEGNTNSTDDKKRNECVAAFVARQVLKNYLNLEQDYEQAGKGKMDLAGLDKGNGALEWIEIFDFIKDIKWTKDKTKLARIVSDKVEAGDSLKIKADCLNKFLLDETKPPDDLLTLKSLNFRFSNEGIPVTLEDVHTVNTGSFHMDAQVGLQPATEQYLEDRRDIETARQKADIEHLQAQTKAGIFYPPYAITHKEAKEIADEANENVETEGSGETESEG